MKKVLVFVLLSLLLFSGCAKKTDEHIKRYVFEREGKISEEVIFTLDETETYITHIYFSIIPTKELLSELAGSEDGDALMESYMFQVMQVGLYGAEEEKHNDIYFTVPLKTGQTGYIYENRYTADIDIAGMSDRDIASNDLLRHVNMVQYYNTKNRVMYFRPTMIRDDHQCLFFPAVVQGETK